MKQLTAKAITSIEVAEMVKKDHKNVLRDIRVYVEELAELKIEPSNFFSEGSYLDVNNQSRPCYMVTLRGCEFIGNKLTGIKGTEFTAKYINRFHDMEQLITEPKSPLQLLELEFAAIKEVSTKVDAVNDDLQSFKMDMPILGLECDRITSAVRAKGVRCLEGKNSNAYSDNSLRGRVYSDIYGQLKREFGLSSYKAIKRRQTDMAVDIINGYELPHALREEIFNVNAQMNII